MSTDSRRWQRIGEIFDRVADAPADRRAALLGELCAGDAALRGEVEALLRADAAAERFDRDIDSARDAAARAWHDDAEAETAGARIGPWRVVRELGRGGMGVVLLAERADGQYEQRAALKLIKRGMDSESILARFLRERQILARLEHPHIARLLDGGIADDGRPYFAMEYVEGSPLVDYCSAHAAAAEARIGLFLQVCAAVQFAHGRLVVHRDIKPSNILVTPAGEAKLLDFGIAKLTGADAADTVTTLWRDSPLTPAYAAPEQLRGEAATVATDIYALGGVLYELLAGKRPFGGKETPALEEMRRLVETTVPPAPSAVVAHGAPVPAKTLRGDLDTIVLKALHRDPARRYATVEALASDLRRYLRGLPVSARRDSAAYRVGKFVGRHRAGVALAGIAVLALLAATGVSLYEAKVARAESARADQQAKDVAAENDFLLSTFESANPFNVQGATVTARELLEKTAGRIDKEFAEQPSVAANLHVAMGDIFFASSRYAEAQQHYAAAHEALLHFLPVDDPRVLGTQVAEFEQRLYQHDITPVIAPLERIANDLAGRGAAYADVRRSANATLMDAYRDSGDYARAARIGERIVAEDESDPAVMSQQRRAYSKFALSVVVLEQENLPRAAGLIEQITAKDDGKSGPLHFGEIFHLRLIADLMRHLGRENEAQMLYARIEGLESGGQEIQSAYLAKDTIHEGMAVFALGDYARARAVFRRAEEAHRRTFHDAASASDCTDARVSIATGSLDEAQRTIDAALDVYRQWRIPDHPNAKACREAQLEIALAGGDASAESQLRELADAQAAAADSALPYTLLALAHSARARGDAATAHALIDKVLHALERQGRPRHPFAYAAYLQRAEIEAAEHNDAKAREARMQALACALIAFGETHARTQELRAALEARDAGARSSLVDRARAIAGQPPAEGLYQRALRILARAGTKPPQAANEVPSKD